MWWHIPIVLLLSLLPLPLLFRACVPPNTSRVFVLAAVGSVGLAVAFFCLWKWLDAHLSPALAPWLATTFGVTAVAVRDLGLRDALDPPIFAAAKASGAVVLTKDADFAEMVTRLGPPPQVLWLRCGNTSNAALRVLLGQELPAALTRLAAGEPLVELGDETEA